MGVLRARAQVAKALDAGLPRQHLVNQS